VVYKGEKMPQYPELHYTKEERKRVFKPLTKELRRHSSMSLVWGYLITLVRDLRT